MFMQFHLLWNTLLLKNGSRKKWNGSVIFYEQVQSLYLFYDLVLFPRIIWLFMFFCQSILPIKYIILSLVIVFVHIFLFFFVSIHCCVYEQWIEGPILNLLDLSWSSCLQLIFLTFPLTSLGTSYVRE